MLSIAWIACAVAVIVSVLMGAIGEEVEYRVREKWVEWGDIEEAERVSA